MSDNTPRVHGPITFNGPLAAMVVLVAASVSHCTARETAAREETKRVCISAGRVGAWAFSGCNNS
jgi:hypothetical protein